MPYLHITTRIEGRKDEGLFREKGGRGFPTMKFMDADGNVLGEPSGRDVASFETSLTSLMVVTDLEKRIAAGEEGLENELFLAKMRLGLLDLEEAKAQLAELKDLTKEEKAEVAGFLVNLEVMGVMDGVDSEEAALAAGAKFKVMLDEGRIPTGDALGAYWSLIMNFAESKSDIELFEKSLNALKEKYGAEEGAKPFFDEKAAALKAMRESAKVGS